MPSPTYPPHITWTPDPGEAAPTWRYDGYSFQHAALLPPPLEDVTACCLRGCPVCAGEAVPVVVTPDEDTVDVAD